MTNTVIYASIVSNPQFDTQLKVKVISECIFNGVCHLKLITTSI